MSEDTAHAAVELLQPFISTFLDEEPANAEERLARFQQLLPGPLPDDYASTLLSLRRAVTLKDNDINSIEPPRPREPGQFVYIGPNPPIHFLYGLGDNRKTVFAAWNQLSWRMPPGLVPIGGDVGGNQICINVDPRGHGRIYHFFIRGDPGPDDELGRPGWNNTFLLADSFTDLCRRIVLRPEDEEPPPLEGPVRVYEGSCKGRLVAIHHPDGTIERFDQDPPPLSQ